MHRLPESKVAIANMEQFLATKDIKIKRAYLLELLAVSRGFNNYNVMKSQEKITQQTALSLTIAQPVLSNDVDDLYTSYMSQHSSLSYPFQYYLWQEFPAIDTILLALGYEWEEKIEITSLDDTFTWQIMKVQNFACEQTINTGKNNYQPNLDEFSDIIVQHTLGEKNNLTWWDVAYEISEIRRQFFNSSLSRELKTDDVYDEDEKSTQNMVYTLRHQTSREVLAFYEKLSPDETRQHPSMTHVDDYLFKPLFKHCFTQPFNHVKNIQINSQDGQLVLDGEILRQYYKADNMKLSYAKDKIIGHIHLFHQPAIKINISIDTILNAVYLDKGFWFLKNIGCIQITGWDLNTQNQPARFYILCGKKPLLGTNGHNHSYKITDSSIFDIYCNGRPYKFGSNSLDNTISYLKDLCQNPDNKNLFTVRHRDDHHLVYFNTYGMNQEITHSL
jgi:hypothetical protein